MTILIKYNEKDRIRFKGSDQTCSVEVDGKEVDGFIVGMSTNGTYTIQTLDEVATPEEQKPQIIGADDRINDGLSAE